jgi:N-acetylmuramoyl-L-alanine amidase
MLALLAAFALAVPPSAPAAQADALRPPIVQRPIPFGAARKRETAAYARRHYGLDTFRLRDPHVIVEHLTVTSSIAATYNTFAPDRPDVELHELPGVCSHFVVGRDGTIVQFVPLSIICRHTVGLNWTAFGIEHVGARDSDLMGNPAQLRASLRLTRWLRCRSGIKVRDVIGHNESLTSPYHRENVARLRRQTHADLATPAMRRYRAMLRALPCSG